MNIGENCDKYNLYFKVDYGKQQIENSRIENTITLNTKYYILDK